MLLRFVLIILMALTFVSGSAQAQEYAKPNWPNLIRTMVRFNAFDINDQSLLDEYTIITDCDIYQQFYHNDFKWNQVRQAVLKSIQMNVATYPSTYQFVQKMQLDRYDFDAKLFRFSEHSTLKNINTFVLYSVVGNGCGEGDVKFSPRRFRAVLSAPIYLEGLPYTEKDAASVLKRMEAAQNVNRFIYARFNMRVIYIDPLRKKTVAQPSGNTKSYQQAENLGAYTVRFDVRLDSISFFEDEELTQLIYTLTP